MPGISRKEVKRMDELVVGLLKEGWLTKDVVKQVGISECRVHHIARRNGFKLHRGRLNKQQEMSLIQDYRDGMKICDIESKYDISDQVVWNTLDRYEIERLRERIFTPEEDAGMVIDYISGVPIKDIEAKYNCTRTKIYYLLEENSIKKNRIPDFSEEKEKLVISMYLSGMYPEAIKNQFPEYESCGFVYNILKKHNVPATLRIAINDDEIPDVIERYVQGEESSVEIAEDYGCSPTAIINVLKKAGVERRDLSHAAQVYSINENYFETIDTPGKAYWLGFIFGDGCVHKNTLHIGLQLQDKPHLAKFLKAIDSEDRPIRQYPNSGYGEGYDYAKVAVTNKKMASDLRKHNVVQNKTYNLVWPETLPVHLYPHFIRGKFDADGCLCIKNPKKFYFCITSFLPFLFQTEEKLKPLVDVNFLVSEFYSVKSSAGNLWVAGNRQIIKFIDWMFENHSGYYLDRKYAAYQKSLELYKLIQGSEQMEEYLIAH
jgi:Mor family transcriptional regulator